MGLFRSAGENRWLSYGLALLARVRTSQERLAEARTLLEEARGAWNRVQTTYGQPFGAYLLSFLGTVALIRRDDDTACAQLEASLRELQAAGDDLARAVVLGSLGLLAARRGEHARARAEFTEGLQVLRGGGDQWDLALLLLNRWAGRAATDRRAIAMLRWEGTAQPVVVGLRDRGSPAAGWHLGHPASGQAVSQRARRQDPSRPVHR